MFKRRFFSALICGSLWMGLSGCQSSQSVRKPDSVAFEYDSTKVQLLKWAAQNRILFQISDTTLSDVPYVQIGETCKTMKEPIWSQAVFQTLDSIKKNPALQNKVHIVEIKKAEKAGIETSKDLDGLTYLIVSYKQHEKHTPITDQKEIPCGYQVKIEPNQQLTTVSFELPSTATLTKSLKNLPTTTAPDRWNFNPEFLSFLADKMTILKFSPDLGFERTAEGSSFFAQFLDEQAQATKKSPHQNFDYWLNEISQRSHAGSYLKVMALIPDRQLNYGMGFTQNSKTLAYPFLSYKSQGGKFTYTSLNQLDRCLSDLSSKYKRGLASIRSDYSTQADTFLYPGHTCRIENP